MSRFDDDLWGSSSSRSGYVSSAGLLYRAHRNVVLLPSGAGKFELWGACFSRTRCIELQPKAPPRLHNQRGEKNIAVARS